MQERFLHAKPWMLFVPLLIPYLAQVSVQATITGSLQYEVESSPDLDTMLPLFGHISTIVAVIVVVYLLVQLFSIAWQWSVNTRLVPDLPVGTNLRIQNYKIAAAVYFIGTVLTLGIFAMLGYQFFTNIGSLEDANPEEVLLKILPYIGLAMFLAIAAFAAALYTFYFTGKTIRSVELGRPARGSDFLGYTVLNYLLVIGIWILQPKIKRYVETGSMTEAGDESVW